MSEMTPPFPFDLVDLQLLNVASGGDVPSMEIEPPESDPLNALLPALHDRSLNVQVVSVTLGVPLKEITDASIDTALPLASDPKFTVVSVSVPPLTEKTG